MIPTNLAYDYVRDIPWDKTPAFAFSDNADVYLSAFQSIVDRIPDDEERISFSDDIWDFNPYFKNSNTKHHRFRFNVFPFELRNYAKFFVLHKAMGRTKLSTAYIRITNALSVIAHVMEDTPHNSIFLITTDDLLNEIKRRNSSPSTAHNNYEAIYQFYYFLVNNYHLELPVDLDKVKRLGIEEKELSKKEDTKLPDIPEAYFAEILDKATAVMRNSDVVYNDRATACIIVMLSQLGLRIGDLMALTTEQLFSKSLPKSKKTAYYIHYKSCKPSKPHDKLLEFDIFCNSLCTEAYTTLKKIRGSCEFAAEPFLYVLNPSVNSKDTYPVANHRFNHEFKKFLFQYVKEASSKEWPGIPMRELRLSSIQAPYKIAFPDTRQFRVHLCTALYDHGIPLVYIQKYMGHLSEYMLGYYVRPKDTYQENIAYSEKLIQQIAGEDLCPIGLMGSDLRENIKQFIADRNFDVKKDIHEIMNALDDKIIIRGKVGGVCIKTSIMPCSKDARTNELLCAYGLCPNMFHFFYMADITYNDFLTLQQTYEVNLSNQRLRAAQKELHKLKDLLKRKLIPELDELDIELKKAGEASVLSRYPTLCDIIANKAEIRKEIDLWMNKQ